MGSIYGNPIIEILKTTKDIDSLQDLVLWWAVEVSNF
jgi:hypothetical protein